MNLYCLKILCYNRFTSLVQFIYLLQVDVGLHYLFHSMLGQRRVFLEKRRQRFIITKKVLEFETCG